MLISAHSSSSEPFFFVRGRNVHLNRSATTMLMAVPRCFCVRWPPCLLLNFLPSILPHTSAHSSSFSSSFLLSPILECGLSPFSSQSVPLHPPAGTEPWLWLASTSINATFIFKIRPASLGKGKGEEKKVSQPTRSSPSLYSSRPHLYSFTYIHTYTYSDLSYDALGSFAPITWLGSNHEIDKNRNEMEKLSRVLKASYFQREPQSKIGTFWMIINRMTNECL